MHTLKVAFPIINLPCGGGPVVEHVIRGVPGVIDVYVNPATETAYVEYEAERLTPAEIAGAVRKVGCEALLPGRVLREVRA